MPQTIGTVNVKVNSTPSVRVQSIQYLPNPALYTVKGAADVSVPAGQTGRGVLTYDSVNQEFIVQDVPRLNGGTF
jgi:hypothetical protein